MAQLWETMRKIESSVAGSVQRGKELKHQAQDSSAADTKIATSNQLFGRWRSGSLEVPTGVLVKS